MSASISYPPTFSNSGAWAELLPPTKTFGGQPQGGPQVYASCPIDGVSWRVADSFCYGSHMAQSHLIVHSLCPKPPTDT